MTNTKTYGTYKYTLNILFLVFTLSVAQKSVAQQHEFGVMAGGMGFVGDVGETKGFTSLSNLKSSWGIVYKFNVDDYIALRASFTRGSIIADDIDAEETFKQQRGLKFESKITEFSAIAEYNFFRPRRGQEDRHHTPYLFAGFSSFTFNPQATLNGVVYDLQELGTEGQVFNGKDNRYSLTEWAIPFGMGYKANLGSKWRIAAEFNIRKTFTDYLDDASTNYASKTSVILNSGSAAGYFSDPTNNGETGRTRASSNNNDWFYTTSFSLTYVIQRPKLRCEN